MDILNFKYTHILTRIWSNIVIMLSHAASAVATKSFVIKEALLNVNIGAIPRATINLNGKPDSSNQPF